MEFAPIALLGALVYKFVDFLKFVKVGDWNSAGTQAVAWLAGIWLLRFRQLGFSTGIEFGGQSLASLNFVSQVVIGLSATSLFSAFMMSSVPWIIPIQPRHRHLFLVLLLYNLSVK